MIKFKFTCALFIVIISTLMESCTDQRMSSKDSLQAKTPSVDEAAQSAGPTFDKTVGAPISRATALQWMENFSKKNPKSAKEYNIDAVPLQEILANASCIGISLYYANDPQGSLHFLPIGVDRSGKNLPARTVPTQNGKIDWETAQQWINSYNGPVRAHFNGTNTYTRLFEGQKALVIRVSLALNDAGFPQALLSNANDPSPKSYEDVSQPCPPYCPTL